MSNDVGDRQACGTQAWSIRSSTRQKQRHLLPAFSLDPNQTYLSCHCQTTIAVLHEGFRPVKTIVITLDARQSPRTSDSLVLSMFSSCARPWRRSCEWRGLDISVKVQGAMSPATRLYEQANTPAQHPVDTLCRGGLSKVVRYGCLTLVKAWG
jgi:hypothetical protein